MTEKEFLDSYDIKDYDAPLCSVDIAIFAVDQGQLKSLLIKRSEHPFMNRWALPGGFFDLQKDISIEDTAFRKLVEKTGVKSPYLEQVGTIGNSTRDPRGWSVTVLYYALIDFHAVALSNEVQQPPREHSEWAPVDEALERDLAFDHQDMLRQAVSRLESKTRYAAVPINLRPEEFTLTELQHMFEVVLGTSLEKKSFRRRLDTAGILEETGEARQTGRRPAALFRVSKTFEDDFTFPGILDAKAKPR
jgi:8-oxo-dGTP diphosphatase